MVNNSAETFLAELGFTADEAKIYLTLSRKGPLTVLELSRQTHINRTSLYRILEKLQADSIVEKIVDQYRQLFKAVEVQSLELMIKKQETKVARLRQSFPAVAEAIARQSIAQDPQTKVMFHKGQEGIARMIWHTLRARTEMCSYTYRAFDEIGGETLAERWQDEWIKRKLVFKELYSDEYLLSIEGKDMSRVTQQQSPYFISRYIPGAILAIKHQVDIYNDVVAYYNWHEGEVFGVEIYSQKVADMQKQLFALAWRVADQPTTWLATPPTHLPAARG